MKTSTDLDLHIFILRRQIQDVEDVFKYHESQYMETRDPLSFKLMTEAIQLKDSLRKKLRHWMNQREIKEL